MVTVTPREVEQASVHYPLFFAKDPTTGAFGLFAMLGFQPTENLFLQGNEWRVAHVPLRVRRGPFSVAFRPGAGSEPDVLVQIDLDDARVGTLEGERLFHEDDRPSAYLEQVTSVLSELVTGAPDTRAFVQRLMDERIIEAVSIEADFVDGSRIVFDELYTVSSSVAAALTGSALEKLHAAGDLRRVHAIERSLSNIRGLIDLRNARLTQA